MKVDIFQDQTLQAMEAYMTRLSQRQQVVASNLANIDTPGYKSRDISFYATLQELIAENSAGLRNSRPEHSQGWVAVTPQAQAFEVQGLPDGLDGNNVDLDKEMLKLSETTFGYSVMALMLRAKFHTLASSISEGRS
jgi:flagellar basal-body rod protein FlgB